MEPPKEAVARAEARSGSSLRQPSGSAFSEKILALANPPKEQVQLRWELKGTAPFIGTIWYLLGMWPLHLYLVFLCAIKLQVQTEEHIITVVQVLITFSLAATLLFSVSLFLKLEIQLTSPTKGATICLLNKYPAVKHLVRALSSQQYSLHGLAAVFLMLSASLLQLGGAGQQHKSPAEAGGINATGTEASVNHSESHQGLPLPTLSDKANISSTLLCLNVLAPMVLHSMAESDPVWKRARLWGASYSAILVLASVKFVASSLTFHLLYTTAALTHRQYALFNSSLWVPPLYALSLTSLFLFCVSLKVYVELSSPDYDNSTPCVTLRRKFRPCPSSLALLLTTAVQIAWEVPLLAELYSRFMVTSEVFVLMLGAFNLSFCLVCCLLSLLAFMRKICRAHRAWAKKARPGSGLCLAHSFVYQTSKHGSSTKC